MPDMVQPTPMHGAVFVQTLARDLLAQGFSEQQVFSGTGVAADLLSQEKPFLPFDRIASFFEHASDLTGDDVLGFMRGAKREMRRTGLIFYVGTSSPTVRDFIRNVTRYRRVFSDAVEIDIDRLDSDGILRWYFAVPTQVRRRHYVEFGASGLLFAMRQATNRDFCPERVTFHHARKSNVDVFERFFGCPVQFGQAANAYHFKQSDLDLPLMTADNELYKVLVDLCDRVLQDKSRNLPPIVVEVERAIADRLSSGEVGQEMVARSLGMSARTLSRRLAEQNTTFFKTLEDLRSALAVSYLKDSDLSLAEISYLLGYSGLSSFNDAFKRWTGNTPGQYRTA